MTKKLMVVLLAGLCLCGTAAAKDIYVSIETGSNSGDGSKGSPMILLWKVISTIAEGDHVYVAEGWYTGQSKSGVMPRFGGKNITIEGGWNKDFSDRNPFKYLTIIGAPPDVQGNTAEVFKAAGDDITIDGFCIDRGTAAYYFSDGEPGARQRIEGHQDNSCWGYRNMNKGKSGTDPTIEIEGKRITVRNCLLINNFWWGIYVKAGGTPDDKVVVENNLILISQGRAIEVLTGGGWGQPTFIVRNNTVIFNNTLKTTEGDALMIDTRKELGEHIIENNVLAMSDGGGVTAKFKGGEAHLKLKNNKFFFNRRGDYSLAGTAVANADEFEDECTFPNEGNVRGVPELVKKLCPKWVDRWSMREDPSLIAGDKNTEEDLMNIRAAVGLKEYTIPGYDKIFPSYKHLPSARNDYSMSRYPFPMKKGEKVEWAKWVLPLVGAEGQFGIQPFEGKPVWTEAADVEAPAAGPTSTNLQYKMLLDATVLQKLEALAKQRSTSVDALINEGLRKFVENP